MNVPFNAASDEARLLLRELPAGRLIASTDAPAFAVEAFLYGESAVAALLNDAQRSRLNIVLHEFEKSLREADAWLSEDRPSAGALYRRRVGLSAGRRAVVRAQISAALDEIASLAQTLHLDGVEEDMSAKIAAEMINHWSDLIDSRSHALRRYGAVNPELAGLLDERLTWLAERALALAHLVQSEE